MSNYTKLTDFASKDALPTGNAAKIVKGTEIDDEFEAIETAIATKANTDSPALTGTPTAPTPAANDNSTKIATTAYVDAIDLSNLWPVGSVYINAGVSTNPATLLGFGTWVAFGAGKVMVGLDSGDTDFDTLEETGGEKEHTLTVDEMPSHTHGFNGPNPRSFTISGSLNALSGDANASQTTDATGGGQAHNNLQPYIVVHMWKRTA